MRLGVCGAITDKMFLLLRINLALRQQQIIYSNTSEELTFIYMKKECSKV